MPVRFSETQAFVVARFPDGSAYGSSLSKSISGRHPTGPIGAYVETLGCFDPGGDATRFYDCEEKEDPDWIHHPEAGLGDAIDRRRQNISYQQAAKCWFAAKSLDRAAITIKQYETN
jgi:hypothetical protein